MLSFNGQSATVRSTPLLMGVGVHFGIGQYSYDAKKTAKLVQDVGFTSVRDDLVWAMFARVGLHENASPPPQVWRLYQFLNLAGVEPLLILGHAHPFINGGTPPMTDEGREEFAHFAKKAVTFTSHFNPIYEVWSEWNIDQAANPPWVTGPGSADDPRSAQAYVTLARKALVAVRQAAPSSRVLVGASGLDPEWRWTLGVYASGLVKEADGLSIHLSNHCDKTVTNRTATNAIDQVLSLQDLLGKYQASQGKEVKPQSIYVSEIGWPSAPYSPCPISEKQAADNLSQFLLWSASVPWLKGAWLYEAKDQGHDKANLEDNFGLVTYDYQPKPATCAVREAVHLIKGATAFHLERPDPDLFVLQLSGGAVKKGKLRLVAWTTASRIKGHITFTDKSTQVSAAAICSGRQDVHEGGFLVGPEPLVLDVDSESAQLEAKIVP